MEFVELKTFDRIREEYLSDSEYRLFQKELIDNPRAGKVMSGTGGFRKFRWSNPGNNKGKSGGVRVIYYYYVQKNTIFLVTIISKSKSDNLAKEQRNELKLIASFIEETV